MNQFYSHFENWEDYKNGMYSIDKKDNEEYLINKAIELLTDNNIFYNSCNGILKNWPIAVKVNLTNKQCNRKAWLGQAACNYTFDVPEILTRVAWGKLSIIKKIQADNIALIIIKHFELSHENKNKKLHFLF